MSSDIMTKLFSDMNQIFSGKKTNFKPTKDMFTSEYCRECEGDGIDLSTGDQCEQCEVLHKLQAKED